jgi:hypothetical protein
MTKRDAAHLVPALVFDGLLGIMLVLGGVSLRDTLLAVCGAYVLVNILELFFDLTSQAQVEDKP